MPPTPVPSPLDKAYQDMLKANPNLFKSDTTGKFGQMAHEKGSMGQTLDLISQANKLGREGVNINKSQAKQLMEGFEYRKKEFQTVLKINNEQRQGIEQNMSSMVQYAKNKGKLTATEKDDFKAIADISKKQMAERIKGLPLDEQRKKFLLEEVEKVGNLGESEKEQYNTLKKINQLTNENVDIMKYQYDVAEAGLMEMETHLERNRNILEKIDDLFGLQISQKLTEAGFVGWMIHNIGEFGKLDIELNQLDITYGNLNKNIGWWQKQTEGALGTTIDRIRAMASELRIEDAQLTGMIAKLENLNVRVLKDFDKAATKQFLDFSATLNRVLGVSEDLMIEHERAVNDAFGRDTKLAMKFATDTMGEMTAMMRALKGIGQGMNRETMETILKLNSNYSKLATQLKVIEKDGKRAFDNVAVEKYRSATIKLTGTLAALGVDLSQIEQLVSNITDVDRISENIVAFSKFGITIEDAISQPGKVLEKTLNGVQDLADEISNIPQGFQRAAYLKMYEGALPKEMMQKLMSVSNTAEDRAKLDKAIKDYKELQDAAKELETLKAEGTQSAGLLMQDLQRVWFTLLKSFSPVFEQVRVIIKMLANVFQGLSTFFNNPIVRSISGPIATLLLGKSILSLLGFFNKFMSKGAIPVTMEKGGLLSGIANFFSQRNLLKLGLGAGLAASAILVAQTYDAADKKLKSKSEEKHKKEMEKYYEKQSKIEEQKMKIDLKISKAIEDGNKTQKDSNKKLDNITFNTNVTAMATQNTDKNTKKTADSIEKSKSSSIAEVLSKNEGSQWIGKIAIPMN